MAELVPLPHCSKWTAELQHPCVVISDNSVGGRLFPPPLFFFCSSQGTNRWAVHTFLERAISTTLWLPAICSRPEYNIQKQRVIGYRVWELAGLIHFSWGVLAAWALSMPVCQEPLATWHSAQLVGHLSSRTVVALDRGSPLVAATAAT